MIQEIRTATITAKGQIVIPRDIRKKNLRTGSKVAVLAFPDRIEIRPIEDVERMYAALLSQESLARDWDTPEEDKAWKDL